MLLKHSFFFFLVEINFNYEFLEALRCGIYIFAGIFLLGFFCLYCEKKKMLEDNLGVVDEREYILRYTEGGLGMWTENYVTIVYTPPVKFV